MSDDLKSLLDKIEKDGVAKAEAEKERILAETKKEAKSIIEKAKRDADAIIKKAKEDEAFNRERGEAAIRQAARDVALALEVEIKERLHRVVKACVDDSMTPTLMGQLIVEMQKKHLEEGGSGELETLFSAKDLEKMEKLFLGALKQNLKSQPELSLGHDFGAGLKIGFKGSDLFLDLSDEAITALICDYIGPRLAKIIRGGE